MAERPSPDEIKTYRAILDNLIAPAWKALSEEQRKRAEPGIQVVTDFLAAGMPDTRNGPFMRRVLSGESRSCPVCERTAMCKKRALNKGMAAVLIAFHRTERDAEGYSHIRDVREWRPALIAEGKTRITDHIRDWVKLQLWEIMAKHPPGRTGKENATGYWRITEKGHAFLQDELTVPKFAHDYDNECKELSGPMIGIQEALTTEFNYREIMGT